MLYRVVLKMFIGEYEKYITHYVTADCGEDAEYKALVGETHNTPLTKKEWCNGDEWWDGDMVYQVYSVKDIPEPLATMMVEADVI